MESLKKPTTPFLEMFRKMTDAEAAEFVRRLEAYKRGLPEDTTTWADINTFDAEILRKKGALKRGLPETATWADINAYDVRTGFKHF